MIIQEKEKIDYLRRKGFCSVLSYDNKPIFINPHNPEMVIDIRDESLESIKSKTEHMYDYPSLVEVQKEIENIYSIESKNMTHIERKEQLERMINQKKEEIRELKKEVAKEDIAIFNEKWGLKPDQHFLYENRKMMTIEKSADEYFFKAHFVRKNGEMSKNTISIYNPEKIRPI